MYKQDLASNNLHWLICHKTKLNQLYSSSNLTLCQILPMVKGKYILYLFLRKTWLL